MKIPLKQVLVVNFILALLIFSIGFMLSYGLDRLRVKEIITTIEDHELFRTSYILQDSFSSYSGNSNCEILNSSINTLKKETRDVGVKLSRYGEKAIFSKLDFDYLKRKYFLLELKMLALTNEFKKKCNPEITTIVFFYKIDDTLSLRQGSVLNDIDEKNPGKFIILSLDINYKDDPIIPLLVKKYEVNKAPTIIVNGNVKIEGFAASEQIKEAKTTQKNITKGIDFNYVSKAAGINSETTAALLLDQISKTTSNFAIGDAYLAAGRMTKNQSMICKSVGFFENVSNNNLEEKALAYETIASLNCGKNSSKYYLKAAVLWDMLNNTFRRDVDLALGLGRNPEFKSKSISINSSLKVPNDVSTITIGKSKVIIDSDDIILTQTDRVRRDWLSGQLAQSPFGNEILNVFSERLNYPENELRSDIGWHEGGRIKQILENTDAKLLVATGTLLKKINGSWYAPNEEGVFMFDVPLDKVSYPTTRFLRDDLAVQIDTHGVNMLVDQAIKSNASVIIGCCDNIGKIKAAVYLESKGKKVICLTDKELPLALGRGRGDILGSPPIKFENKTAILGAQQIVFSLKEPIIFTNYSKGKYALWYYETPAKYFKELEKYVKLNAYEVKLDDFGQMYKAVREAKIKGAKVIAARIFNYDDYATLKEWLEEKRDHRLIMFHSVSYPYGYLLFNEFKNQTSFDDPIVVFS